MIIKRDVIRLYIICELTAYFVNQFPHASSVIEISMFDVCNTSPAKRSLFSLFAGYVISVISFFCNEVEYDCHLS